MTVLFSQQRNPQIIREIGCFRCLKATQRRLNLFCAGPITRANVEIAKRGQQVEVAGSEAERSDQNLFSRRRNYQSALLTSPTRTDERA